MIIIIMEIEIKGNSIFIEKDKYEKNYLFKKRCQFIIKKYVKDKNFEKDHEKLDYYKNVYGCEYK